MAFLRVMKALIIASTGGFMNNKYKEKPRDVASELIECYILENNLSPHDKLPSERDFCEMWQLNRTTLRSAIHYLITNGMLYNKLGSGTYVAESKLELNLQDLHSTTQDVIQSKRKLENLIVSENIIECTKQLTRKMRQPLGHKLFELTRVRIVDDHPMMLETSYIDAQRCKGIENYDYAKESLYAILESKYNIQLKNGIGRIGISYVDERESQLLGIENGTAVIYRSGVTSDIDNITVEYFNSIAVSQYVRFSSVLKNTIFNKE